MVAVARSSLHVSCLRAHVATHMRDTSAHGPPPRGATPFLHSLTGFGLHTTRLLLWFLCAQTKSASFPNRIEYIHSVCTQTSSYTPLISPSIP